MTTVLPVNGRMRRSLTFRCASVPHRSCSRRRRMPSSPAAFRRMCAISCPTAPSARKPSPSAASPSAGAATSTRTAPSMPVMPPICSSMRLPSAAAGRSRSLTFRLSPAMSTATAPSTPRTLPTSSSMPPSPVPPAARTGRMSSPRNPTRVDFYKKSPGINKIPPLSSGRLPHCLQVLTESTHGNQFSGSVRKTGAFLSPHRLRHKRPAPNQRFGLSAYPSPLLCISDQLRS